MPQFKMPASSMGLLLLLEQASLTGKQDRDRGVPLLDDVALTAIDAFLAIWGPKARLLDQLLAARSKEARESYQAVQVLETYVRDAWIVQKRRIAREGLPAEVHRFYGMELDGSTPRAGSRQQWIEWAQRVVEGDAAAALAGYEPMANPSAVQVAAKLALARAETQDVALADRAYDEAQKAVADGRAQAEEVVYEVMDQLRFNLRRETPESQRRVMRTYGAQFSYTPGEPVDPEDEPVEGGEEI
jgi:hypothetical protein